MKPGRARRKASADARAARRRQRGQLDPVVRARLDRFVDAFARWQALTAPGTDVCPFCGELVAIVPDDGKSHYSHREPVCPPWVPALTVLGGYDLRRTGPIGDAE